MHVGRVFCEHNVPKKPPKIKSLTGMNMDGVNEVCHHVPVIFVLFDGIFHSSSELYSAPDFNPGWGGGDFWVSAFLLKD